MMKQYTILRIKNTDYKLRLGAAEAVELEKRIGKNPLSIFLDWALSGASLDKLPFLGDVLWVLYYAMLKFQPETTYEYLYTLYDEFIDGGNQYIDLCNALIEMLEVSGYFHRPGNEGAEKN